MSERDLITMAMMFNARMALDLTWALDWWTGLEGSALNVFRRELEERRKGNPALDACAKEAGL